MAKRKFFRSSSARFLRFICGFFLFVFPSSVNSTELQISAQRNEEYSGMYLCKADAANGFQYDKDKNSWSYALFDADDERLILKVEEMKFGQRELGFGNEEIIISKVFVQIKNFDELHFFPCEIEHGKSIELFGSYLRCENHLGAIFEFNLRSLKYVKMSPGGYTSNYEGDRKIAPYVEIGECSRVE